MKRAQSKTSQRRRARKVPLIQIKPELLEALNRIPNEHRLRLEWIIDLVEKPRQWIKNPEMKKKLDSDIYAFIVRQSLAPFGGPGLYLKTHPREKANEIILRNWSAMIRGVINREKIHVANAEINLMWWPPKKRFLEMTIRDDYYEDSASRALGKLLIEYGHLVKQCPAPALRGKKGETCEAVFVASRPNQNYHSSACQSRASTARNRPRK